LPSVDAGDVCLNIHARSYVGHRRVG
jgi:hypothetical protein